MKLLAASALALSLTLTIGCAEGNAPAPETEAVIANASNKVQANITGMDCTGCSYGVETALNEVAGVTAAKADHATGEVTVALADDADGEAAKAEIEKVLAGLSDGKYTVNTITVSTNIDAKGDGEAAEEPASEEPATDEQASTDTESFFTASYNVTGMDCSGCSSSIVKAVEQVEGVEKAEADHKTGKVQVAFTDGTDHKVKSDEVKTVIAALSGGKFTVSQ